MRIFNVLVISLFFSLICRYSPAQDDYLKWLQKEQEKLKKYIDEEDKKFIDFLRKEWIEVGLDKGLTSFKTPKPVEPTKFTEEKTIENLEIKITPPPKQPDKPEDENIVPQPIIKREDDKPQQEIMTHPVKEQMEIEKSADNLSTEINFYGTNLNYTYNENIKIKLKGKLSKETIADFWLDLSASNYKSILQQALSQKSQIHLNDWGYVWLLNRLSEKIYPELSNERILFVWFMLVKSGYLARVGYSEGKVALLVASNNKVFDVSYLKQKDHPARFYRVTFDEKSPSNGSKLYTYSGQHSASEKLFEFALTDYPSIGNSLGKRTVRFNYNGQEYVIPLEYDISAVKFFERYPHTEYSIYFSSKMSEKAKANLLSNLKPYIENKTEYEAVNFLLHFVQKATEYKTDDEQFGREKPLFPEESLFYRFSDCEDRSVLFAYLVRGLIGLEVIGLDFPNHIATAVKFNQSIEGDFITYKGSKYVICDPTYIGADVGRCMPAFKNAEAKIIVW